jgi:hypothetical protein
MQRQTAHVLFFDRASFPDFPHNGNYNRLLTVNQLVITPPFEISSVPTMASLLSTKLLWHGILENAVPQ